MYQGVVSSSPVCGRLLLSILAVYYRRGLSSQGKVTKMGKRHQIMKDRFEDLEKRRNLEVEGYKNDIKALRKRLKEMQQQIFKVRESIQTKRK